MRSFFSLAFVCLFVNGCYLSHGREDASEPIPGPPPIDCPVESDDPVARFDVDRSDVFDTDRAVSVPAGTRGVVLASFRLTDTRADLETAEYPYRFARALGSLTTPDGGPVFTNARLVVSERTTLYGPYNVIDDGDEVEEGEFWDANLLRAGGTFTFTFLADVAEDAVPGATYEVRLGDDCSLSPRFWYSHEDGTTEMPIELIGGNDPITIRVAISPAEPTARFHFCEHWLGPGPGVTEELIEAFGYRGCCVDGGEFPSSEMAEPGMFVKATGHTVYYIASDGRRYVFPSSHHLASWFVDASRPFRFGHDPAACEAVVQVPDAVLASIPIGGNAPVRPGLLTMGLYTHDVYATDHGNVLRSIQPPSLIDDGSLHLAEPWLEGRGVIIHDAYFGSHHLSEPVTADSGYNGDRLYREATLEGEIRATYGW